MTAASPAKDRALNAERIARIGREISTVLPAFDAGAFTADVMTDLPRLELKARIARTAKGIHDHLPVSGTEALDVLLASLPPTPDAAGITNDFGIYVYAPHSDYVARYCRDEQHLDAALGALARFTCYFSAEDAVRQFLNAFPDQAMTTARGWADDADYRVRRLASESTRPRLPWSTRIPFAPTAALPILERLHPDATRFVNQSVANHLRDITVTDPDVVLGTLARWRHEDRPATPDAAFIAREALKNKLKEGWPPAYEFLGYPHDLQADVAPITLDRDDLTVGETLIFRTEITVQATTPLHVTYIISPDASPDTSHGKVYFLTRTTATPQRPIAVRKQHLLRPAGTAAIKPGTYVLQIQVNGRRFPAIPFQVRARVPR